jgi:hypothetical protein
MNTPGDFSQYYAELLERIYDCVDASSATPFSQWGRLAAACAAGGRPATIRNWMTSICAKWQGYSPAACMRSVESKGF